MTKPQTDNIHDPCRAGLSGAEIGFLIPIPMLELPFILTLIPYCAWSSRAALKLLSLGDAVQTPTHYINMHTHLHICTQEHTSCPLSHPHTQTPELKQMMLQSVHKKIVANSEKAYEILAKP